MSDEERLEKIKERNKKSCCNEIDIYFLLNLIEKKDKIIDLMAKHIEDNLTVDEFCTKKNCYADNYINGHCEKCLNCIKEYFRKKVEND